MALYQHCNSHNILYPRLMDANFDKSFGAVYWASHTQLHVALHPYRNPPDSSTRFYAPTSETEALLLHNPHLHAADTCQLVSAYKAAHREDFVPYNRSFYNFTKKSSTLRSTFRIIRYPLFLAFSQSDFLKTTGLFAPAGK